MDKRHQKQAKINNSCCSEGTHNFILLFWFAFNSCLFSGGLRSYFMTEVGIDCRKGPRPESRRNRKVLDNETWRSVCKQAKRAGEEI
ncbi:hypothetical protein V6N11_077816 [Hibiscus sabdariffa]|uniref:Uncharacterized protein n=1 Tax=Hibiscus sabdariffa TaxID=183260 RepID=A0ABR2TE57_9ROSI